MSVPDYRRRAQTNIQLYQQLHAVGYGGEDIGRVREAYGLATKLFASQLRPEGRPFVCHLVGAASILAMLGSRRGTTIAGLLHSAYSHGDFGQGRGQVTSGAQDAIRAAVGPEVERLLACYARHPWNRTTAENWLGNVTQLDPDMRQVALIRLADVLEDALDQGLQRSSKVFNPNRDVPMADLVRLADAVGCPEIGAALRAVHDAPENETDLEAMRDLHVGSYVVCPPSWREKILPRLLRLLRRVRADR